MYLIDRPRNRPDSDRRSETAAAAMPDPAPGSADFVARRHLEKDGLLDRP